MLSVPQAVENMVMKHPFAEEGIRNNLFNLSSFARLIKPQIDELLHRNVSIGSIVMALKRMNTHHKIDYKRLESIWQHLEDVNVRSNLVEFAFQNSDIPTPLQEQLLKLLAENKDMFITVSQGVYETAIILRAKNQEVIKKLLEGQKYIYNDDLASITVSHRFEGVKIPGVYYSILKALAWNGINIDEFITTYNEFTIILKEEYVNPAFEVLKGR